MSMSRVLPSQFLEEAEWYFSVRNAVLSEQAKIDKIKKSREKK